MTPKPESETDPVRELCKLLDEAGATVQFGLRAQGHIPTIERMLADGRSWKSIGKEIGWEPLTAAEWYVRELIDARAAEAAQHQQALVDLRVNYAQSMRLSNETLADTLARLAAVEAERDKAIDENIRLTNAESEALRAERDRLKAALQDAVYTIAGWRTGSIGSIGNVHVGSFDVEHLARLRAVLTSQGQSTDGETR